jgi:hypothetical protein
LLATVLFMVLGLSSMAQAVPILQVGDIAFKFSDVTFFDQPAGLPGGAPIPPGGIGSGITFGIANVSSIHTLLPGSTIDNPILSPVPIWTPTPTDLLQVRFGGMKLTHYEFGGATVIPPGVPAGFPYNAYFGLDPVTAKDITGDGVGDIAYLEIYSRSSDGYSADVALGPDGIAGINPVTGVYGSFGANIAGAGGTLWLDLKMEDGVLPFYDPFALLPVNIPGLPATLEATTVNALTTGAATIYSTIVGGTAAGQLASDVFPLNSAIWGTPADPLFPLGSDRADIKLRANLLAIFDQTANPPAWTNPFGWTANSEDPVTGTVVPEPSTILLLGAGLIGLAGFARKRIKK